MVPPNTSLRMTPLTTDDMEKVLKEAGLYEENMSKEEMENCYKAIANSKDTATTENKTREWRKSLSKQETPVKNETGKWRKSLKQESSTEGKEDRKILNKPESSTENLKNESSYTPQDKTIVNKSLLLETHQNEDEENVEEVLDATKAFVSFEDMPKCTEENVEIIVHPMKYVNIQNSKEYQNATFEQKAIMLYSYHTKLAKLRSDLYRKSFFVAPLPKPIILKEPSEYIHEMDHLSDTPQDTYVSRSGRHVKKRIYYDDDEEESLEEFSNKKPKLEESEWLTKSETKVASNLPQRKSLKNLTNKEILEASTLFSDSPVSKQKKCTPSKMPEKSYGPKKSARSEAIFDKLILEKEKADKEEKRRQAFQETLSGSEDEFESQKMEEVEEINVVDLEPLPVLRRVLPRPPIATKKPSTAKASTLSGENGETSKTETLTTKNQRLSKNGPESLNVIPVESDDETCPICGLNFPENIIEEHAASCGDDEVVSDQKYSKSEPRGSRSKSKFARDSLTCINCNKVFVGDFAQHARECIQSRNKTGHKK